MKKKKPAIGITAMGNIGLLSGLVTYFQEHGFENYLLCPSAEVAEERVASCLWEIENAFKFGKPDATSSYRVNFMGALVEENRTYSVKELDRLLSDITKRWSGVEFIHSEILGKIMGSTNG